MWSEWFVRCHAGIGEAMEVFMVVRSISKARAESKAKRYLYKRGYWNAYVTKSEKLAKQS